jgi:hypothetical protein
MSNDGSIIENMDLPHIHLVVKHLKAFEKITEKVAMCPPTKLCFDCLLHGG